ncbi:MAG: hypothetical protein AAF799_47215 [Myxococcota bacterium]
MKSRGLLWFLAVGWACTPTGEETDPISHASEAIEVTAEADGFVPKWTQGQTWAVELHSFASSMDGHFTPFPTEFRWRYRVEDVSSTGVATISVTELDWHGKPLKNAWVIKVHESGVLMESTEKSHSEPKTPIPFLPYLTLHGDAGIHVIPWWPRFPLIAGAEHSFFDGALTQSVTKVDDAFVVEMSVVRRDGRPYPSRQVSMTWEPGRPFWSSIHVLIDKVPGPEWAPFEDKGEVRTWDETNPWAK